MRKIFFLFLGMISLVCFSALGAWGAMLSYSDRDSVSNPPANSLVLSTKADDNTTMIERWTAPPGVFDSEAYATNVVSSLKAPDSAAAIHNTVIGDYRTDAATAKREAYATNVS
jgi:hypothetical protein